MNPIIITYCPYFTECDKCLKCHKVTIVKTICKSFDHLKNACVNCPIVEGKCACCDEKRVIKDPRMINVPIGCHYLKPQ